MLFFESELEYEHIFLYYIDSAGNLIWKQSYANRYDHPLIHSPIGDGIQKFGDNYLIHGECYYPDTSNPGPIYLRPLFVFIDEHFEEQWILPFGVSDTIIGMGYHSTSLNDSTFMGVGIRRLGGSKNNSLLMFFNEDGEQLGFTQFPNEDIQPGLTSNAINDISRLNDTLFLASTNFGFGDDPWPWGEMIIDTAGNIYSYEIRPDYTSGWTTLVKTFDDKYTIGCGWLDDELKWDIYMYKINENLEHDTIYPGTYTYDSLCPYQIQSGEIDLSDCMIITNVEETPSPKEYYTNLKTIPVKAYPNPSTTGMITLEYQNTRHHQNMELRCFNIFGEQVHKETIYPHQGKSVITISTWQKGIYLGLVYSNGQVVGKVKFVIR